MRAFIALALLSFAACADETPPAGMYVHTLEQCPNDPLANCEPSITIREDGTARVVITDVINEGSIGYEGDGWRWNSARPSDAASTIYFTPSADGTTVTSDYMQWVWVRQ